MWRRSKPRRQSLFCLLVPWVVRPAVTSGQWRGKKQTKKTPDISSKGRGGSRGMCSQLCRYPSKRKREGNNNNNSICPKDGEQAIRANAPPFFSPRLPAPSPNAAIKYAGYISPLSKRKSPHLLKQCCGRRTAFPPPPRLRLLRTRSRIAKCVYELAMVIHDTVLRVG